MWTTAQLKKIEETPLCVTLWFVEHDGKIDPLCVLKTHAVEVRCSDFGFGQYTTTIGELVNNLSPFVLLYCKWSYDICCNLAVDVDAGVFMTILPLDDRRKNGFSGGTNHNFDDIINDISNDIAGRPIAIYPALLCSYDWGESFRIIPDNVKCVPNLSIEPNAEVEVRGNGTHFIAAVKDLFGVRLRADLMSCNPHAIIDGVIVAVYAGNTMKMERFIVNLDAVDYDGVRNEKKKRLNSMYGVSNTAYMICREPDATIFSYGLGEFYKLTYQTPCGLRSCEYKHDDKVNIIERGKPRREAVTVTFVDLLNGIPGKTYTDSVYTKITDAEVKYRIADLTVLGVSVYLSGDIFDQVIAAAKRRKKALGYIDTDCVHDRLTFGPGKIYAGTPGAFGGIVGIVPETIRRAIIENGEEKKMRDQFRMEIHSRCAGRYPWRSSNDATAVPKIKKVYFNKPVTVVLWEDGTKTVVKCQPGERYDAEKGLAMAISKKALGNTSKWYDALKKELENAPKPKKRSSTKKKEDSNDEKA